MKRHHSFVIEAEAEEGIATAQAWAERELKMNIKGNPDVIVLRYGLISVEDARRVTELAAGAPFRGEYKVLIISANRAYHEAQNALLKLFEEPPPGTYLFFVLQTLGGLLPTLRSRVGILLSSPEGAKPAITEAAKQFIHASREKRTAIAKKLASGTDEEERREHRDEVIQIVNGIEAAAYEQFSKHPGTRSQALSTLLNETAILRGYLHDRSAPVRMMLEHLSIILPKNLI